LAAIEGAGIEAEAVPDLCALASRKDPRLKEWADDPDARIIACYPRTVQWLFEWAGAALADADATVLNMREGTVDEILAQLPGAPSSEASPDSGDGGTTSVSSAADGRDQGRDENVGTQPDGTWIPWFPVIDRERCKNCRQCLNFCPFGVYELSDAEQVDVRHPANCKTNCPACARMCPDLAIIFPKYGQAPINGAPVQPEHLQKQKKAADLKDRLKKEDIHSLLAKRGKHPLGCPLNRDNT
jgi:NAD-dependent dihydropyrimidine dehydrogenase PreA subunit